jgi:hypothetical protein
VTGLALLLTPLPALAVFDFAINIQGPGAYAVPGGITIIDNAPEDQNSNTGQMQLTTGSNGLPAIPGFGLSFEIAQSNSPGAPPFALLDVVWGLNSLGGTGGTIQVTTSADNYGFPPVGGSSILTSTVSGNAGSGSVTAQQWVDLANGLFVLGAVTPGVQVASIGGFSNTASSAGFTPTGFYSITDRLNLTLGPNDVMGGDLTSTVVPEPVTMFLGGTGLLMLTCAARRRLFGR